MPICHLGALVISVPLRLKFERTGLFWISKFVYWALRYPALTPTVRGDKTRILKVSSNPQVRADLALTIARMISLAYCG